MLSGNGVYKPLQLQVETFLLLTEARINKGF